MSDSGPSFLSRWSRRKSEHRQGDPQGPDSRDPDRGASLLNNPPRSIDGPVDGTELSPGKERHEARTEEGQAQSIIDGHPGSIQSDADTARPLPPIESLTPDSDFSAFTQANVDASTQARALKRLFIDPHFNRIDEMDIDIEDFGIFEEISPQMLRSMEQARSLGFFEEDEREADHGEEDGPMPDPESSPGRGDGPAHEVAQEGSNADGLSNLDGETCPVQGGEPGLSAESPSRQNRVDNS